MRIAELNREQRLIILFGSILIFCGLILLLLQIFGAVKIYWLPLITGALFVLAGILTRVNYIFVPGGLLTGVGIALLVLYEISRPEIQDNEPGVVVMGFAGGCLATSLFTRLFTGKTILWTLIAGGILAVLGAILLFTGMGSGFLSAIEKTGRFNEPGTGIAFVLAVEQTAGLESQTSKSHG